MRLSIAVTILVALLAGLLSASCGGNEEAKVSATPGVTGTPLATSPAPATSPAEITLQIPSVVPSPAHLGEEAVVTFKTAPGAIIGFTILDGAGQIAAQTNVTAGADGIATYGLVLTGAKGTWLVQAAAGATIDDLLRLQASPTAGPYSADFSFEVQ
jgi:hypothetical protein